MNFRRYILAFLFFIFSYHAYSQSVSGEMQFDNNWKFFLGDAKGAESPSFNDKSWRNIDLPHDWSIEQLPGQEPGHVVGPFSKKSQGATATGYVQGGTGWYRKTFALNAQKKYSTTMINFDGVYMNCDVWVNGKLVGNHPYGYTAFDFDITGFLNPAGKANVIAVKVKNEGQNSRWYSGSGIYRHVWLIQKQAVHLAHNGVSVTTENISTNEASVKIVSTVNNIKGKNASVKLLINIVGPDGKISQTVETQVKSLSTISDSFTQNIVVQNPKLWSVETPNLYTAEIQVVADGAVSDKISTTFGIRTISFS